MIPEKLLYDINERVANVEILKQTISKILFTTLTSADLILKANCERVIYGVNLIDASMSIRGFIITI